MHDSKLEHVSISRKGIEIRHEGTPINSTNLIGYVYLLVDCSASMEGNKLNYAKKGALNFAKDALRKGYFTGLIKFDSSAMLVCEPFKDINILKQKLIGLDTGNTTHMAKAITLAHNLMKEVRATRVIVIVTDGMPNDIGDPFTSLCAGENAKRNGIDIIAIGTDDADKEFLKRLSSRTELAMKVSSKHLEKTISSSVKLLPARDKRITKKQP